MRKEIQKIRPNKRTPGEKQKLAKSDALGRFRVTRDSVLSLSILARSPGEAEATARRIIGVMPGQPYEGALDVRKEAGTTPAARKRR